MWQTAADRKEIMKLLYRNTWPRSRHLKNAATKKPPPEEGARPAAVQGTGPIHIARPRTRYCSLGCQARMSLQRSRMDRPCRETQRRHGPPSHPPRPLPIYWEVTQRARQEISRCKISVVTACTFLSCLAVAGTDEWGWDDTIHGSPPSGSPSVNIPTGSAGSIETAPVPRS